MTRPYDNGSRQQILIQKKSNFSKFTKREYHIQKNLNFSSHMPLTCLLLRGCACQPTSNYCDLQCTIIATLLNFRVSASLFLNLFFFCHSPSAFLILVFYVFFSNFCHSWPAEDTFLILSHVCSISWHSVSALSFFTLSCYQHFLLFLAPIYVFMFCSSTLIPFLDWLLSAASCPHLSCNPFYCFWLFVNCISSFTVYPLFFSTASSLFFPAD